MLLNGKELFDFIFSKIEYSEKLEFEYKIENESQNENEKRIINEIKKILDEIVDGINKKFKLNEDNFDPNDL